MNEIIVFVASYLYLASVALFAGYFFSAEKALRRRILLVSFFALPISYLSGLAAGFLYYDPRPFAVLHITPLISHVADNGFPSDHALLMGTLAAIVTVFNRRLGALLWALAIIVGVARVLAAIHHPLDILASFAIAIVATFIVVTLLTRRKMLVQQV
ncbi:MAG: phosphatase PAP2 family protein [Minisyncoccota bacterium]